MAKADSPAVGLMKYGVMLFSLAYLFMSIITSFHVVMRANSLPTTLVAIYFYTHVVANWMALFSHSNKDQGMDVPAISDVDQPAINKQSSSNYCSHCDILRHKLSHHCPLCRCCVLKHDHHCFFFGTCVGKNNQPFFVILCLYTGIGSLYLCLLIFQNSSWFFPAWYNYAELFMPFGVVFSLYRASNLYDAYMVIAYNASTTIGMVCLVMLGLQVYLLSSDLTWHEYNTAHRAAETRIQRWRSAWSNFQANFGSSNFRHFLIPVMPSFSAPKVNPQYRRLQV